MNQFFAIYYKFAILLFLAQLNVVCGQIKLAEDVNVSGLDIGMIITDEELELHEFLALDFSSNVLNSNQKGSFYYGNFTLQNTLNSEHIEWIISFSKVITDIEFYNEDGLLLSKSGSFVPLEERTVSPTVDKSYLKVLINQGSDLTLFFKARIERENATPNFNFKINSLELFYQSLKKDKQNQGLFFGFLLMIMIYNFFLYFLSSKDIAYVFYSLYLFFIIIYISYNTGDLADRVFDIITVDKPQMLFYFKLSVYPIIIFYLLFLRKFLDLKQLLPIWNKVFKWMIFLVIPLAILDGVLMTLTNYNYDISDVITLSTSAIFLIALVAFCIVLYREKDVKGYFILVGTLVMVLGGFITIFLRIQTVDYSTVYLRIGVIIEVIVFSLGLAYRNRKAEQEKQEAFFALEKSKILQQQEAEEMKRLREIDEFKDQFYTNITHEFRTPLTLILGMVDEINGFNKETKAIKKNSNQLLRLINQMLDLSKIESNKMETTYAFKDAISYLGYLTESFYSYAISQDIRLTFYAEVEEVWMDIDEDKLEKIIYNLLSNALKYTDAKGKVIVHIKLGGHEDEPKLKIKIKDTGIGIPKNELPKIFNRFYEYGGSEKAVGTGVGLALVKEMVELLGGVISVQSSIGKGSEFEIVLPITNHSKNVNEESSKLETVKKEKTVLSEPQYSIDSLEKMKITLVEDNVDVANYISDILRPKYDVEIFEDGVKGVTGIMNDIPDLVISDVMMPFKDGYELTQELKNDPRTNHIPIILLTAKASYESKIEGLGSGADEFLLKPFDKKELLLRIENIKVRKKNLIKNYQRQLDGGKNKELPPLFIQKLWDYIDENISKKDLKGEDLAQYIELSSSQLTRKVKSLTGQSPNQFIRSYRLKRAIDLLKTRELNVSEVAYKVGFNDPSYFTRVFSKEYGKSPTEYLDA